MAAISCPVCAVTGEPGAIVAGIVVCGHCGASLVVDQAGIRRAVAADTVPLSAVDCQTLQATRGRIARPERRQR